MSHQVIIPSGGTGGDGLVALTTTTCVVTWIPPHSLSPAQQARRIERANEMRLAIIAMLDAPAPTAEA